MRKWIIAFAAVLVITFFSLPKIVPKSFFIKSFEEKSRGSVEIGSMNLSWFGPQKFKKIHWTHDNITATVEELTIDSPLWSLSGPFHLKNGSLFAVDAIEGSMEGNDFELTNVTLGGHLSLKGKIYSKLHFNIQIDIENFPLQAIDPKLDQIFGPTLSLAGSIAMSGGEGTIDLDLSSQNIETQLRGFLSQEAITLRESLHINAKLTPEISSLLLNCENPMFPAQITSENPIAIHIAPEDFHLPLPYSLEKLTARGTLDLGKTKWQNTEFLASVVGILKKDPLSDFNQMNVWFAPVAFRVESGNLELGRLNALLADSIQICTWGRIDLNQDQLNLFIGLPANTLAHSFGIKDLPENFVLKVPLRGSPKNPDIVKGGAAAQIAALIAGSKIKKGFFSGLAGLFSNPKVDEDIPPAQRPFPWEE